MGFKIEADSDIGVRRKDNQDNYWCAVLEAVDGTEVAVACVCDGMGGLKGGALASRTIVGGVAEIVTETINSIELEEAIIRANRRIKSMYSEISERMGTTCTVIVLSRGVYTILHIGDSRCYKLDRTERLSLLTTDHTVLESFRAKGVKITPEIAKKYKSMLSRCLGTESTAKIDTVQGNYMKGDTFLVCSDGFWATLDKEGYEAKRFDTLRTFINYCMKRGETDNITACRVSVM